MRQRFFTQRLVGHTSHLSLGNGFNNACYGPIITTLGCLSGYQPFPQGAQHLVPLSARHGRLCLGIAIFLLHECLLQRFPLVLAQCSLCTLRYGPKCLCRSFSVLHIVAIAVYTRWLAVWLSERPYQRGESARSTQRLDEGFRVCRV
jgi:hypothetical protein